MGKTKVSVKDYSSALVRFDHIKTFQEFEMLEDYKEHIEEICEHLELILKVRMRENDLIMIADLKL